jgi:hypothetical protein
LGVVVKISRIENQAFFGFDNAAVVVGSSLIYSQDFSAAFTSAPFDPVTELLQEEPPERLYRNVDGDEYEFFFKHTPVRMGHVNAEVVPFNTIHPYNYFHFLIEALPSLLSLLSAGLVGPNSLLVTGVLHENMQSALQLALHGVQIPMLELGLMQYVSCDRAVGTPDTFQAAQLRDGGLSSFYYDVRNLMLLRNAFKNLWEPVTGRSGRKLFVERPSRVRSLVNSDSLVLLALAAGYEVVDPGQMSFREQVRLFSSAFQIIGPTGAWLANLAFVQEGVKVTVFLPETAGSGPSMWVGLGAAFGVQVKDVLCPVAVRNPKYPIHSDFSLAESTFLTLLNTN